METHHFVHLIFAVTDSMSSDREFWSAAEALEWAEYNGIRQFEIR